MKTFKCPRCGCAHDKKEYAEFNSRGQSDFFCYRSLRKRIEAAIYELKLALRDALKRGDQAEILEIEALITVTEFVSKKIERTK